MKAMKLVRLDPNPLPPAEPTSWTVGFDVTLDDGTTRHSVTTVYAAKLDNTSREGVVRAARDEVLPALRVLEMPALSEDVEIPPAPKEKGHAHR